MEKGRVGGNGGKRIREAERERRSGAKQIEGVDPGENDGVFAQIERGGRLREFPWGTREEERAWAWAWPGREESVIGWGAAEAVAVVRRVPGECGY